MQISWRTDANREAWAELRAFKELPKALRYLLQKWEDQTTQEIKRGIGGGYIGRRTGHLAQAIDGRVQQDGELITAEIGTNIKGKKHDVPYAAIQDRGGDICPRRARALTIPLGNTKGRAANFPNLFLLKRPGKLPLLAERIGKGKLKARFLLSNRVTIKPTGYFSEPAEFALRHLRYDILDPENIRRHCLIFEKRGRS